jgi:hypothetical protein
MKQYQIETPNGKQIIDSKYPMEDTIIKFVLDNFKITSNIKLDQTNTDTSCIIYYQKGNPANRFKISLYP